MKFTDQWTICPEPAQGSVVKGEKWRITVLTDRLFRLEYDPEGIFRNTATQMALNRNFPVPAFTVTEKKGMTVVETASVRISYDGQPFSSAGMSAILKDQVMLHASVWHYGEETTNLKGTARTLDRANGEIPLEDGILSVEGFAVIDDSRSMGIDLDGSLLPAEEHGLDLYLFAYGRDGKAALKDYFRLSGPTPKIPRYALGNWWSRYYCYTEKTYKELMERFAKEQVPLSVAVIDMNWHITDIDPKYGPGWTGYTWNPEMFPDPKAMLTWLHEHGLKVTLNDHPAEGIRACEDLYPQMAKEMGIDPQTEEPVEFDSSSREFLDAYEKVVLDSFEETGVDFWWIDWQQQGGSSIKGVDTLSVLNQTRWLYANRKDQTGMTFSRYGGPGSHRYPVGFSGDSHITWASLQFQPYFTANAANIGYGWWSHDIGGHMQGVRDEELTLRWLQFGIFSPIMRLHSTMSEFLRKEPWTFEPSVSAIMEDFLRLRHRLVPWLYDKMLEASEENSVILYPMYYDHPYGWDPLFVQRNEYMFGSEMLVAPIVTPADDKTGLGSVKVWLPDGAWVDFFNGHRYEGGQTFKACRRADGIPVFVRTGTIIPMDGSQVLENGCPLPEVLQWRIFAGADGRHVLREDNGAHSSSPSFRSCSTECLLAEDAAAEKKLIVTIGATEGDLGLLPKDRKTVVEIVGIGNVLPEEEEAVESSEYDEKRRTLRMTLKAGAGEAVQLSWKEYPVCPELDKAGMLYDLILPVKMANPDKDRMLEAAQKIKTPEARLAAYMSYELPEGLAHALAEMEMVR